MKNWDWRKICEWVFWILVILGITFYHFLGWFGALHYCYDHPTYWLWAHYIMPSPLHEGVAGFSYISVTTGLNLALVKFEVFTKTVEDIENLWTKEIDDELATFPAAKIDDDVSRLIHNHIINEVGKKRKQAYTEHKERGLRWRWLAIRLNVIGLLLLFFQYSAGILGAAFVLPVLGSVWAKRRCKEKLNREISTLKDLANSVNADQSHRKSDVDRTIAGA